MTITLVQVKGSALTIPEFDGNFQDLDGRLEYFETGTGQPGPSIVNVTAAGNIIRMPRPIRSPFHLHYWYFAASGLPTRFTMRWIL